MDRHMGNVIERLIPHQTLYISLYFECYMHLERDPTLLHPKVMRVVHAVLIDCQPYKKTFHTMYMVQPVFNVTTPRLKPWQFEAGQLKLKPKTIKIIKFYFTTYAIS